MNNFFVKAVITIAVAYIFSWLISVGFPPRYWAGFLLLLVIVPLFFTQLPYFLFGLFLFRPAVDGFLTSVRIGMGGSGLGLGGGVAMLLIIGTVLYLVMNPSVLPKLKTPVVTMYLLFCLVNLGSFMISGDKGEAAKVVIRFVSVLAMLVLCLASTRSPKDVHFLAKAMKWSPLVPLLIGAVRYAMERERFAATFAHPNILAFFILFIMALLFFRLESGKESRPSAGTFFYMAVLGAALALTQTRSAWGALVLMSAIYAVRYHRRLIIPGLLLLVGAVFTPFVQEKIANVFSSYGGSIGINEYSSLGWRVDTWKGLFKYALQSPVWGHGLQSVFGEVKEGIEAHNDYLRFFVESGLVGVVAYFFPYFYILGHALKNQPRFEKDSALYKLAGFFISFIPAFLLMSVTENLASYVIIHWYVWGLVGMYFALLKLPREESAS